ncbi:MAG: TonB-dependent receptor, partial [Muribaculaceae bacterium]|nr:TonB-dependent receptor [Muribaculaceae bacterium]
AQGDTVYRRLLPTAVVTGHVSNLSGFQNNTYLSRQSIERLNIVSMKQVSEIAPNFYIPEYGSRMTSSIYMRGIGARIDQAAVGLMVDGVAFLNKDNYDFDLADISRITVSRGPQSSLYGRNTMAGMITINTLSAMEYTGVRASAEAASGNSYKVNAAIYLRPSSNWGTSISASFASAGGFMTNVYNNTKADREESGSARWKLDYRGTGEQALSITNTAAVTFNRQHGYPYAFIETGEINYNDTCFYSRTGFSDGLSIKAAIGRHTLTSKTSAQYIDDNMTLDQDFLPVSYFTLTQKRKEWAFTEDLTIDGTVSLPGDGNSYNWLGGVFGFYKRARMSAPVVFKETGIEKLIIDHRNGINPMYPIEWDTDRFTLGSEFTNPVGGAALYHHSTLTLGQRLSIALALRLDFEHTALNYQSTCNTSYTTLDSSNPDVTPIVFSHHVIDLKDKGRLSKHFLQFLPRLSVSYATLKEIFPSLYLTIAKGYKAGGYNTQMFSDVLQQSLMETMGLAPKYDVNKIVGYKPEKSWNFETGAQIVDDSHPLSANFTLFYIDCRDQQLTMFPDGTTTGRIMTNAGHTRSLGVELQASYTPAALPDLTVRGSYGFTDARFLTFNNGIKSFDGKRVPYAPANTLFLDAAYTVHLRQSTVVRKIRFSANCRGVGDIYWDEDNLQRQPFYLQAGASISLENLHGSIDLWAENLTDTHFTVFQYKSIGNTFYQAGKPRRFGITLRYNFATGASRHLLVEVKQ